MQFSKRTFKIHPNCLWNFYGKKKQNKKKCYSLVKRSLSQGNWLRHQQLGSAHPKVERHLVSFRYHNPVCRVVMLSLGSLSTTKQRLYTPCVYNTFFFLIDHGSALQDHGTLYLLSFRREEEIRQQISGSVQDIEELSVGWMSGAWPDRKNIL